MYMRIYAFIFNAHYYSIELITIGFTESWLIGSVWEKSAPADSSAPGLSQGGASPRHAEAMRKLAPRIDICRRLRVRASVQSLSPLAAPPTYLFMLS